MVRTLVNPRLCSIPHIKNFFLLQESCPRVLTNPAQVVQAELSVRLTYIWNVTIKHSATVGWACKLLGCFCSWMGDATYKVNCGQGRQASCLCELGSHSGSQALMLCCCCLKVLNNFWIKASVFLLCTWSCKLSCRSWVLHIPEAAPCGGEGTSFGVSSWEFTSPLCNFPAVWVWLGCLTSLAFSVLISKSVIMVTIISDFYNCQGC